MSSSTIKKHLYRQNGSTDIKMNAKQLPRELYLFFGSKEVAEKIYKMIHGEQVKNTEELANL